MIAFFETMPSAYRTYFLVGGLVGFWLWEGAVPLLPMNYPRGRHAALNLLLTFFQLILALILGTLIVATAGYGSEHRLGLLYLVDLPLWLHALLGVMLLDCISGYWIHRIEHLVPWMWRFHVIHHTDRHVDVTTGLRHHPVETLFRLGSQWAAVAVGGIPIGVLLMYQATSIFFAQLTHANIRLWRSLDRILSWIVVTPRMHKVHHHYQQPLTDMNYGNVFSCWDRLFGSFVEVDATQLTYGIDSVKEPADHEQLSRLILSPFGKQE